ncbi:NO-inducible flavohemoprotein [Sphingomonas sp. UV9]|uniref:NO-inducible flavohemoprotein n=1 Tax=Sphingomonas sp. UV9 TaxID=1851410 RepID=UPI000FFC93EB|nr:NO-inducible flavohemoprotein [Sphingomonas sp. UV9]RXD04792.1 NO-inducible flavohemoprotein [Sphingomonas sp. UV9]
MSASPSLQTIAIVKATVVALEEHGGAITGAMYRRLFEDAGIAGLFNTANQKNGAQVHALASAVLAYARNIENLGVLGPTVERIAQKHIGYAIRTEHYPYVATALLGAIEEVLGDAATPEVLAAWGEAYWFLAGILTGREETIRTEIMTHEGGWTDWRGFVIAERRPESEGIVSFVLKPVDGRPVLRHLAGQYLTFRFDAAGLPGLKRNFSISSGPSDDYYRITVKRQADGGASAFLHDHGFPGAIVETTPPAGDFFLADVPDRPIVLLSGGVGLTPMVSMMEMIAHAHSSARVWYVHGTASREAHALDAHIRELAELHGGTRVHTFYERRGEADDAEAGLVTIEWLKANTPFEEADFYLCGPRPFLRSFVPGLIEAGIPSDQVHYELFGPTDEAFAA